MLPSTQRSSPLLSSILPPPLSTLPPSNVVNALPPSNVINAHQPNNVTLVLPSYSASPPLPAMLLPPLSNSLPPNLITLPPYTCHRTSESIGLEAHPSSRKCHVPIDTPAVAVRGHSHLLAPSWPSTPTVHEGWATCARIPAPNFKMNLKSQLFVLDWRLSCHYCCPMHSFWKKIENITKHVRIF